MSEIIRMLVCQMLGCTIMLYGKCINVIIDLPALGAAEALYSYDSTQLSAYLRLQILSPRFVVRLAGVEYGD